MKLKAKIKKKHLDEILNVCKAIEYRQFESIELTDETGRKAEFGIDYIARVHNEGHIRRAYPDISWIPNKPIYKIRLGRQIT